MDASGRQRWLSTAIIAGILYLAVGVAFAALAGAAAFGLVLVANIHDLGSVSGYRPRMLIALVARRLLTAVPAFVVALAVAAGLRATRLGAHAP